MNYYIFCIFFSILALLTFYFGFWFVFIDDPIRLSKRLVANFKRYLYKRTVNFIELNPKYFDFKVYKLYDSFYLEDRFYIKAHLGCFSIFFLEGTGDLNDTKNFLKEKIETRYNIQMRKTRRKQATPTQEPPPVLIEVLKVNIN